MTTTTDVEPSGVSVDETDINVDEITTNLIEASAELPEAGDIVEGSVLAIEPNRLFIDLHPYGTGVIYGKEFINSRHVIRNISVGDEIAAKVIEEENEDGYVELSLKEARQAQVWAEADEAMKAKTVFDLPVSDANKGGLLINWQGVQGFLPASQLKPEHYPRVPDGDKDKILAELKELIGEVLSVSIITADPKEGKLIFSEKDPSEKERKEKVNEYEVGDVVEGTVTGVVDFGIFIEIEDDLEGLAHISELDWGLVEDPGDLFSVGDEVKAKVIEVKEGKVSLSVKALKENPWVEAQEKYRKGAEVDGVIIKYNEHGALASVEEGIAGLVHVSDFESMDELRSKLELGKTYPFVVTHFDPKERRMALSYTGKKDGDEE